MILKQVFKTLAGAQKRAAFETAHSKRHRYLVVRCNPDGSVAAAGLDADVLYVWRLNRMSKDTKWPPL